MSRRIVVLCAMIAMGVQFARAQRSGSIMGLVSDSESGEHIPFASVSFLRNNQPIPGGAISNEEGAFSMGNLKFGTYRVVVSFIGYETDTLGDILLSREQAAADLGTIPLAVSRFATLLLIFGSMPCPVSLTVSLTYRPGDNAWD